MLLKLSNLNSNLALTLGYLNPALNNSAQKPEKVRTLLGQSVTETTGFLNTFSTDEPKVITRWGWRGESSNS